MIALVHPPLCPRTKFFAGLLAACTLLVVNTRAQSPSHSIYTQPDPSSGGGISLSVDTALTRAIAVERDRKRVFDGKISPNGLEATFVHLPTGKYDLVLLTKNRNVVEGLYLGPEAHGLSETSFKNLENRVETGDSFYNRWNIQRFGISEDTALVFVERLRDKKIYQQSGEVLQNNVRRFEILEMRQATDNWQVAETRHLYREAEPLEPNAPFMKHNYLESLGSVRVIDQNKNLGILKLPTK